MTNAAIWRSAGKKRAKRKPSDGAALRHKRRGYLRRWPAGIGSSPRTFYHHLAPVAVRDALAFDCMRTAFLTRCIAGLGWRDVHSPAGVIT